MRKSGEQQCHDLIYVSNCRPAINPVDNIPSPLVIGDSIANCCIDFRERSVTIIAHAAQQL